MSIKTRTESALDLLGKDGLLTYGTFIPVKRLEEIFEFKRDSQEFNWLIHQIRKVLQSKGLYLSGEGLAQTDGYSILPPQENFYVAKLAMARAERDLTGKETLLANTNTQGFSELQRARHDGTLRLLSLRLAALRKVKEHNERNERRRKQITEESTEESEE